MFRIVSSGHIALSTAFKGSNDLWLARGEFPEGYPGKWGSTDVPPDALSQVSINESILKGVEGSFDTLSKQPVIAVYSVTQGGLSWEEGTHFTVTSEGIQWRVGVEQPNVNSSYSVSYRYYTEFISSLVQEVDRIKSTAIVFAQEDVNGDIEAGGLKWSVSTTPTKYLYCQFKFPSTASLGSTIYQAGVYTGTILKSGVDPNQLVIPDDMTSPGTLYMIDNLRPFTQTDSTRMYFEIILEF